MIKIWRDISQLVTLESAMKKDGRNLSPKDLSIINDGAIVFDDRTILWTGKSNQIPEDFFDAESDSLAGKCVTPGLVDSHTHLIFGGDRSFEYTMRLNGADYQEIAKAGGGILESSKGTNELRIEDLIKISKEKINRICSYGVKTIEIKSGYGLNYQKEKEISLAIDQLKKFYTGKIEIFNTYMAAHAVPKEYKKSSDYMDEVVMPLLEELSKLKIIDAVDIFHEKGYFTTDDVNKLFERAKALGIPRKIHVDEFNDNDGASLAVSFDALSADHLLMTGKKGIKALAESKTVATLLPGTGYFLGKDQANCRAFLDAGAKVSIASDYNPGSCHCDNLLLIASLAAPNYKMNIAELWSAITLNAAHSLGFFNQGAIYPNMKPIFSIWDTDSIDKITYYWGKNFNLDF